MKVKLTCGKSRTSDLDELRAHLIGNLYRVSASQLDILMKNQFNSVFLVEEDGIKWSSILWGPAQFVNHRKNTGYSFQRSGDNLRLSWEEELYHPIGQQIRKYTAIEIEYDNLNQCHCNLCERLEYR